MGIFTDGLTSLYNSLANRRSSVASNVVTSTRINYNQLNEIYKTGLGNKISRIKTGYSLKRQNIIFENTEDKLFYNTKLHKKIKEAFRWSLVFGRGIIVINDGGNLAEPLRKIENPNNLKFEVFSGKQVSVTDIETDLMNKRYYQPKNYIVHGFNFHYTRVIDFRYILPEEEDMPNYNYGGISEFELIYNQIINDGIIERASSSIVEKNSSLFYKIKGFKNSLQSNNEDNIVKFYSLSEDRRSIHGAGLIDSEDDVVTVSQSLTNLKDADDISLRRMALVTGIPLPMLVGEAVSGLNSAGTQERNSFNDMLQNIQEDYLLEPINELMSKLGKSPIKFSESQNTTALEQIEYETKALDNATKLYSLGYDIEQYLKEKGIEAKTSDSFESEFGLDENIGL